LNDDIRVHSRGTTIRIVHRLRTTWETAVTDFCPGVEGVDDVDDVDRVVVVIA
jgi:hypothetical protein